MKFSRFSLLAVAGAISLLLVSLNIHRHQDDIPAGHGLRVFIDPDSGEFQPPGRQLEQARSHGSLLGSARALLVDTNKHQEVRSPHARGGYSVNLEHYYRPSRQTNSRSGS